MALDARYIIASDLQTYLVDKDTGLPLAAGIITFYKDQARTELKPVYKLSGSPPNYSYVTLENPIILSSVGTVQDPDTGDDIILYYFPYDGPPNNSSGKVELYYVTVESADNILQFTREAWPNFVEETSQEQNFQNFAPNGQFLFHNDVPFQTTPDYVTGQITQPITAIAQGGWTFERPNASTAKDILIFEPFGSYVSNPTSSPKYYLRINTQSPSAGDNYKDLRLKFTDVNKFASATQKYTFSFTGQSNTFGSLNVSLLLIKYFGEDGSASTETVLANLEIPPSFGIVQTTFVFGENNNKTIGNNDFLQLALRFPSGSVFDVSVTDFMLAIGEEIINTFPPTTDGQFSNQSLIAPAPAPDGSNLYLPIKLGPEGLIYDTSEIGDVIAESELSVYNNNLHPSTNRLLGNGAQYETISYSPLGIPYLRLQRKYWDSTLNMPIYGTGQNYLTCYVSDLTPANDLRVSTNIQGSTTAAADGTPPTGFTFLPIFEGHEFNISAHVGGTNGRVIARGNEFGIPIASVSPGTTSFVVEQMRGDPAIADSANIRQVFLIETTAAAGLAGKYFQFGTLTDTIHMWFAVDGVGTAPGLGATDVQVNLRSSYTQMEVSQVIADAISGYCTTRIAVIAGSSIPAGSYFSIYTKTQDFYVWFEVDNTGVDPAPTDKSPIKVSILSTDTAAQVAQKIQIAFNSKYFAVPDLRGLFLRGWDNGANVDPDADLFRYGIINTVYGDRLGTDQLDDILLHYHKFWPNTWTGSADDQGSAAGTQDIGTKVSERTLETGSYESRPVNAYVNYVIKY